MAKKRKRGRERQRPRKAGARFEAYTAGRFVLVIDTRTGKLTPFGHADPAVSGAKARDAVTRWAVATLTKYGLHPLDVLQVRDAIWRARCGARHPSDTGSD